MEVSENTENKLTHEGETYYFCGLGCLKKFANARNIELEKEQSGSYFSLLKNKVIIITLILVFLVGLSFIIPLLEPFRKSLFEYFRTIWWAILLGLILGGVIDNYIPREYISHLLARPKKRTIFYAVFLGFLMSACSHGILALGIQLHKKGASSAGVVAFLLASPWANLPLTIMLFGFFGAGAIFIILSALLVGITTGFVYQFLERHDLVEKQPSNPEGFESFSIKADIKKRMGRYSFSISRFKEDIKGVFFGAVSLGNMVLWWILLGMGLASLAGAYVPSDFFQAYLGPSFLGLLITLAFATVIEVCSEGSAPMAFELFRQTGALGNSFTFLMAGVATDYTEIGLLWSNVGKKTAIWLPIVTVPQVLVLGWIANTFF